MTSSRHLPRSRSIRALSRTMVAVFASILLSTAAQASLDDDLDVALDTAQANIVKLDGVTDAGERIRLLKATIEMVSVLSALGRDAVGMDAAKVRIEELGRQGITADVLGLELVDALLLAMPSAPDRTSVDVEIKARISALSDPAYRAAGWTALARVHESLGEGDEAERLAERAIADAMRIERPQTRSGALRESVLAVAKRGEQSPSAAKASDAMDTASARSGLYQELARRDLREMVPGKDGKPAKEKLPKTDELAATSRAALDAGDIAKALKTAQAIDRDEAVRDEILDTVLSAALAGKNEAAAIEAAKSIGTNTEQDGALRRIVDAHIEQGRPLRAIEIAPLLLKPKSRADAEIAAADALSETGYRRAAIDILKRIDVSPATEGKTLARVVDKLAAADAFEDAERIAARIEMPDARSQARSRLSKRLSDAGRTEEARAQLPDVTEAADRSFALGGLARGLARAGKIDDAAALVPDLVAKEDRTRALEAIAEAYADDGRSAEARTVIGTMEDALGRSRALTALAPTLAKSNRSEALATLEAALDELNGQEANEELADIAAAFAKLGEIARSDAVIQRIKDRKIRDKAEEAVGQMQARQGALNDAASRRERLGDTGAKARLTGELALAKFANSGDFTRLIADMRPLPYDVRVPFLRRVAEDQAGKRDWRGWLSASSAVGLKDTRNPAGSQKANFSVGRQLVTAPAPDSAAPEEMTLPAIAGVTAEALRAAFPAPTGGTAHVAILGFSPFSQEAFKLTSKGREAIYEVQLAQDLTWPRYIAIESGVVTFGQLMRLLPEATEMGMLVPSDDRLLVRVPIVVLPGATLLMSGQEFAEYRLSATSGAFLAIAGALRIQDTEVVGYDESLDAPAVATEATRAEFRPFITAWGGSDLQIAGSRLAMLGYDSGKAYGLTQSSGAAVQNLYRFGPASPRGRIVDNSFENMRYGYYSYEAENVDVIGNEYRDNIVYGIDPHDRSRHLVIALNTAYGTQKKHGIIVSREVNDSFIIGNISVKNHGSGIMLDRMSLRNLVYANTAVANEGDGLSFYESGCNIAVANNVADNRRAGIKVRNSADIGLFDNSIRSNIDSGADIYASDLKNSPEGLSRNFVLDPFEPLATTILAENEFVGNGLGINATGATSIVLDRNRFSNQRNRVFSGDLRELSSYLLQIGQRSSVSVENLCQFGTACPAVMPAMAGKTEPVPLKAAQAPALACLGADEGTEARAEAEGKIDG